MINASFNPYLFNPVFWHIWEALHNPRIRKIYVRGGSGASKTFSICDALNLYQLHKRKGDRPRNVFALRKHRVHVDATVKASFEQSINRLEGVTHLFKKMEGEIRVATGAVTKYAGMDDQEKIKGLEDYDIIYNNELNQFDPVEWDEENRRLRGRPDQKLIADWNPISIMHWINKELLGDDEGWIDLPLSLPQYEAEYGAITQLTPGYAFKKINAIGDTLWINVTYRDNFWIVGHPVPGYGFVDVHTLANFEKMRVKKPNDYRIYGMGHDGMIRTEGEAWKCYDETNHIRLLQYDPDEIIHLTLDKNVVPYVTVLPWQCKELDSGITEIRQIHEILSRSPNNTAFRAAIATGKWLERINFKGTLFIWGDPSANARSTEDDEGRSFFDKYIGTMEKLGAGVYKVVKMVQKSPPAVSLSIDFINDIYDALIENYRIVIDELCMESREEYMMVKQDPKTGAILKELVKDPADPTGKRKYQKYGHISDAKRYFIVGILFQLFLKYKERSRTPRVMSVPESPLNT